MNRKLKECALYNSAEFAKRLTMIENLNRKTAKFLEHATDEDFKAMFSGCPCVKFPSNNL